MSSYKKALLVFQNYFNLLFPYFSPNLPDFFFYFHLGSISNKKQLWSRVHTKIIIFAVFPNFPIFRVTFPVFLYLKTSFGLLRTLKKNNETSGKSFSNFNWLGNYRVIINDCSPSRLCPCSLVFAAYFKHEL
jgi:hypothetical protein